MLLLYIAVAAQPKQIELRLSFPRATDTTSFSVACKDDRPDIRIVLFNGTDSVASFFEDGNSWGFHSLYFELETPDTMYLLSRFRSGFGKGAPALRVLFPGDSLVFSCDLRGRACKGKQGFENIPMGRILDEVRIRAIYQLNASAFSESFDVAASAIPRFAVNGSGNGERYRGLARERLVRSVVRERVASLDYTARIGGLKLP
ncbi:MAG: hypothetical protein EOO15_08965 [Chitinophagaceae bacterium]|nr:MAG: hypothetical protein EOO15_08965 [Chitinophagaceae bacterium]